MPEVPSAGIPPEEVERRLRDLEQLYELGQALREVHLVDPPRADHVRERPDSDEPWPNGGGMGRRGS